MQNKIIICNCGGDKPNHLVGSENCYRYYITDENEIPKNRRKIYNPEWFENSVWIWDIGDHWVTEYTLFHQRHYSQDENGNWTRPKSKESTISLNGDW